jgi:hypothetical protein
MRVLLFSLDILLAGFDASRLYEKYIVAHDPSEASLLCDFLGVTQITPVQVSVVTHVLLFGYLLLSLCPDLQPMNNTTNQSSKWLGPIHVSHAWMA